nr:unnamed protein product [Digitaria exilis]
MASAAALVTGWVLPACPPRVNHVNRRIRASRSLQFNQKRGRHPLPCSDTRHLFGCVTALGHLTVARAEGLTLLLFYPVKLLPSILHLNIQICWWQKKMETEFSELLDAAERTIGLHFSYDINLTSSAQRLHDLGDEYKSLPLWRQAEPRFLWNSYLLEPLIENKISGFQNIHAEVGSEKVTVTLIARRCTRRIGTRMWRRGADAEGYAANFVESEQIMQSKGFTASYVQVRGSMPFLWEQIVDLTYKPSFDIVRQEEAPRVLERHFHDLQKKYGAVLAVDLVNTGGGEGRLRERYAKSIEPILSEDLRYVHFDFHRVCGHIHFERLSQLYEQIKDYLKKHRYVAS